MFIEVINSKEYRLKCSKHGYMNIPYSMIEAAKILDLQMKFCPGCGSKLELIEIPRNEYKCTKCNAIVNEVSWQFCIYCGEPKDKLKVSSEVKV